VGGIDAAGEEVGAGMAGPLGGVKAGAAGEDQVGPAQQIILQCGEFGVGVGEQAEFVHAVVDGGGGGEVGGEGEGAGGVVPEDGAGDAVFGEGLVEEGALGGDAAVVPEGSGKAGLEDADAVGEAGGGVGRSVQAGSSQ